MPSRDNKPKRRFVLKAAAAGACSSKSTGKKRASSTGTLKRKRQRTEDSRNPASVGSQSVAAGERRGDEGAAGGGSSTPRGSASENTRESTGTTTGLMESGGKRVREKGLDSSRGLLTKETDGKRDSRQLDGGLVERGKGESEKGGLNGGGVDDDGKDEEEEIDVTVAPDVCVTANSVGDMKKSVRRRTWGLDLEGVVIEGHGQVFVLEKCECSFTPPGPPRPVRRRQR